MELLIQLQHQCNSQLYLEKILGDILNYTVSNFDLGQYITHMKNKACEAESDYDELEPIRYDFGSMKQLYRYAHSQRPALSLILLKKLDAQSAGMPRDWWKGVFQPLIRELVGVVDTSSSDVQQWFQSLLTRDILEIVGKEPERPIDWALPNEAKHATRVNCECGARVHDFLLDPMAETLDLKCEHQPGLNYRFGYTYAITMTGTGNHSYRIRKSREMWKTDHKCWERRATKASRILRAMPDDLLRELLVERYDDLMELKIVKAGYVKETNKGGDTLIYSR